MYYGIVYESFEALEHAVKEYIYYYNHKRIKEKLTGMSPVEYGNKPANYQLKYLV